MFVILIIQLFTTALFKPPLFSSHKTDWIRTDCYLLCLAILYAHVFSLMKVLNRLNRLWSSFLVPAVGSSSLPNSRLSRSTLSSESFILFIYFYSFLFLLFYLSFTKPSVFAARWYLAFFKQRMFSSHATSHKADWILTDCCLLCLALLYAHVFSLMKVLDTEQWPWSGTFAVSPSREFFCDYFVVCIVTFAYFSFVPFFMLVVVGLRVRCIC